MKNKYLDFITDRKFEECMEDAMKSYKDSANSLKTLTKKEALSILERTKNTTDEFKAIFDIYGYEFDLERWKQFEITRALHFGNRSMAIKFHVNLLTNVNGWELYNTTNTSDTDRIIKNEDNSIFIDIRNYYNSSDYRKKVYIRDNFEEILRRNPDAVCYRGYIISNNHERNVNKLFHLEEREDNDNIREISGDLIYKEVTGDELALSKTYKAVRLYLKENSGYKLTKKDEKILDLYEQKIFN